MKRTALLFTFFALLCMVFAFSVSAADCEDGKHQFGAWVDVTPATCGKTGKQERTCEICGKKETQISNALTHEFSKEYTVDKQATCMEDGSKSYHCIHCGTSQPNTSVTIPATGHKFGKWVETTAPTCTKDGEETRTCANCKENETRKVDALGHERVTVPAKAPTCTENGNGEGIACKRCGMVFQEALVVSALGHDMIDEPAAAATCTEDGHTAGRHCTRCNYVETKQQVIPKLGHKTVIDPASPSTCIEHGKTQGSHCSVCGEVIFAQQELPLKPHDYEETVVTKTCISDGYHQFTCKNCGQYYRENVDYALACNKRFCYAKLLTVRTRLTNRPVLSQLNFFVKLCGSNYVVYSVVAAALEALD